MVEIVNLTLTLILSINRNKIPGAQILKRFTKNTVGEAKIYVNWFIGLIKIRLLTLTKIIRHFYFLASLHYKPLKAVQHGQMKNCPMFSRNFRENP